MNEFMGCHGERPPDDRWQKQLPLFDGLIFWAEYAEGTEIGN
jgi:hypothetical protein